MFRELEPSAAAKIDGQFRRVVCSRWHSVQDFLTGLVRNLPAGNPANKYSGWQDCLLS
jgi:hypothetical protein